MDYQDEDYEIEEYDVSLITILAFISKWFIRIGIVIGAILLLYFLIKGQILNLLLFIMGLIISYYFGYFFMFCLDKFISND